MTPQDHVTTPGLRTPKAAAIAGIVFAVLQLTAFGLFWSAVPADPLEPGAWLSTDIGRVSLALNLMPIAGVAFLWFIGVVRDRIGAREDRFFASVFLGSGLLFLAMMFIAAAMTSAIITTYTLMPAELGKFFDRSLVCLHPRQLLCDQDGCRLHDHGLDAGDPHRVRAAMAGRSGIWPRPVPPDRQPMDPLGVRRVPLVGPARQPVHSHRQLFATGTPESVMACWIDRVPNGQLPDGQLCYSD
jgi:hypothetical protein